MDKKIVADLILRKFTLINPNEKDEYEELQRTIFRPNSIKTTNEIIKRLTSQDADADIRFSTKMSNDEKQLTVRVENIIKSNSLFDGDSVTDILREVDRVPDGTLLKRFLLDSLKKDTNKGVSKNDVTWEWGFSDGNKITEQYAKYILLRNGVRSEDFILLNSNGAVALRVDDKTRTLIPSHKTDTHRSVDAITRLPDRVIAWSLKYKGGTAKMSGSTQTDQGTTEGVAFSADVERWHTEGTPLTYENLPVVFGYLVYGGQFNDSKRIFDNEWNFRGNNECRCSFNCSLSSVKSIIDCMREGMILDQIHDRHGYDLTIKKRFTPRQMEWCKKWTSDIS